MNTDDVNRTLIAMESNGDLIGMQDMIGSEKIDFKHLELSHLLYQACVHDHCDILSYLIDLPIIGEYDINMLIMHKNKIAESHTALKDKLSERISTIESTRQQELWAAAFEGNLELVNKIIEANDYYDLNPALSVAASKDHVEIVAHLFEKANLRVDQTQNVISGSGPASRMWIDNYLLRQSLGMNLEEKDQVSKHKI